MLESQNFCMKKQSKIFALKLQWRTWTKWLFRICIILQCLESMTSLPCFSLFKQVLILFCHIFFYYCETIIIIIQAVFYSAIENYPFSEVQPLIRFVLCKYIVWERMKRIKRGKPVLLKYHKICWKKSLQKDWINVPIFRCSFSFTNYPRTNPIKESSS